MTLVPIDVTSIARLLGEMISEAKLQLKEQIAQNVKLRTPDAARWTRSANACKARSTRLTVREKGRP
ncbi:hypothetical protein [Paracoccus mutanolyticus]|uniref:hypothetical protein n=1 Tax=Paracoccus mutanolyticus TaxID=1499308 RepID=UPI0011AE3168|nr:hypothetical protein [Paracoccus mutanolyticus]